LIIDRKPFFQTIRTCSFCFVVQFLSTHSTTGITLLLLLLVWMVMALLLRRRRKHRIVIALLLLLLLVVRWRIVRFVRWRRLLSVQTRVFRRIASHAQSNQFRLLLARALILRHWCTTTIVLGAAAVSKKSVTIVVIEEATAKSGFGSRHHITINGKHLELRKSTFLAAAKWSAAAVQAALAATLFGSFFGRILRFPMYSSSSFFYIS